MTLATKSFGPWACTPRQVDMDNAWQVLEPDPIKVEELAQSYNLDRLLAKCILNRMRGNRDIDNFLRPEDYESPSPFLIPDMDKTVDRIQSSIENGERICIYGDYDADGVTAIAILTNCLRELGSDVFYYIPDRFFEGVGLHCQRLALLKNDEKVGLVITVDTGIRAFEEIEYARELGLDVIITDHHTPDEIHPAAYAVLNPKIQGSQYPFPHLCGAGVALKMVQALNERAPNKINLARYLQIAAIGTIADMVPLREENRWIVAQGLRHMDEEEGGPIKALLRKVGIRGKATALDISYKVAPRINAPGRLGDPDTAISFFDCQQQEDITRTIEIMDGMNSIRQMLERELEEKMELQLRSIYRTGRVPPFILVAGRHWHRGILGIMACKILRRFSRPACVISFDSESAHGSIRGLSGLNMLEALHQIAPLMTSFGGHPEAAGVTMPVTNIPQFNKRMNEILGKMLVEFERQSTCSIDAIINWSDLNDQMFENLRRMAPFGIGNAAPVFLSANLILESELMRKGPWFHFEASDGSISRKCSFYHPNDLNFQYERFDSVDLVYSLKAFRNEYQVQIIEMKPSTNET